MSKHNFKVGDLVRRISNPSETDVVRLVPGMREYDRYGYASASEGFILENNGWSFAEDWELVPPETSTVKEKSPDITYKTIHESSDGHRFEEYKIDGKPLDDYIEARKLLQRHARLFKKAKA